MVKAKDFLKCLCNDYNFRFFSGVPVEGFKGIFKAMSTDMMHYIPAANENIALALANGVSLMGINSAIIIDSNRINELNFEKNNLYKIPLLVIAFCVEREIVSDSINVMVLSNNMESDIKTMFDCYTTASKPCVMCFKEGQLI